MASNRWEDGVSYLLNSDFRWVPIVERAGPCTLVSRKDRFGTLVRAIIGQQISTRAATTIDARLRAFAGDPHHSDRLIETGEEGLRSCGLSGVKARYVLNLAEAVRDGHLPLSKIARLSDDEIKGKLTAIKGIGSWTAEMFLIFSLNRPDVLSASDLGIRTGLRNFYGLAELPSPRECEQLAQPWRPHRSVAMWYLWRSLDAAKTSK